MGIFINGMGLSPRDRWHQPGRDCRVRREAGLALVPKETTFPPSFLYIFSVFINFISFIHSLAGCLLCAKHRSRVGDPC